MIGYRELNMQVKISVIIPVYNAELYLEQCIKSVMYQTLEDIEIILLDDGSTDNSSNICYKLSKLDKRIRFFSNKNIGQGLERNLGIRYAKGEYVAFLDSDDMYRKNMLEKLYSFAKNNDADIVSCGFQNFSTKTLLDEHPLRDEILCGKEMIRKFMLDLISYANKDGYSGCIAVWDSIYRREVIQENNLNFVSERDYYSEDLLFKLDFLKHTHKMILCKDNFYMYRVNDTSYTNDIDKRVFNRIVNLHNLILRKHSYLGEHELKKRVVNRTFFTTRFNINKACKSENAKLIIRSLNENRELISIINQYKPTNLKNLLLFILIKLRLINLIGYFMG